MKKNHKLKIKKPNLAKARLYADRIRRERQPKAMDYEQAVQDLPRITNETVAEHREEVLSGARKFIYPLQHSRRRVLMVSLSIFILLVVLFTTYVMLALYSFRSTSSFIYRVTQIMPLPVAKVGSHYISYESYLFELRHYIHYYETQQKVNFDDDNGKKQLESYRRQALDQVVEYSYVEQLARKHNVTVSSKEVDQAVQLLKSQNRLGGNDQVLSDVLKDYWGWSIDDFRRELKQQLLAQKVVQTLDTATNAKAQEALTKLRGGADFGDIASQYSDDPSKENDGVYDGTLDEKSRDIPPQILAALKSLKPGQISGIVSTGSTLEIVRLISESDGKYRAAHIVFQFKPLTTFTEPLEKSEKPSYYIKY